MRDEYFEWLYYKMCNKDEPITFKKLFTALDNTIFRYSIAGDENRALDGIDLRRKFGKDLNYYGPCSVLEVMIALAIRCETTIMDNPAYGDRTRQWFWGMIKSLGLGSMSDMTFDEEYVEDTIERFLNREYEPNGKGGLFTIRHSKDDLRDVEIWYQLCWYLDTLYE